MFKTLLLAVDINDPDGSIRSTEAAVNMAKHNDARLHIINVVPDDGMPIVSASLDDDHNQDAKLKSTQELADWAAKSLPGDIKPELHVARGKVYDQIIKMADKLKVDGIFVGAHSPELKDYLMGTNAARVARHAEMSVFVIR